MVYEVMNLQVSADGTESFARDKAKGKCPDKYLFQYYINPLTSSVMLLFEFARVQFSRLMVKSLITFGKHF